MTDDAISTLYRKPCPSCARQYARDSRACPFCGYVEALASESEQDQERLYGEYLAARFKQAHEEVERLRRAAGLHPEDRVQARALALAVADMEALERDLGAYRQDKHETARAEPPRRATDDKECPVCTATMPQSVGRCACGYVFGAEVVTTSNTCPHCTAPVASGAERCTCGYPLAAASRVSGIPSLRRR